MAPVRVIEAIALIEAESTAHKLAHPACRGMAHCYQASLLTTAIALLQRAAGTQQTWEFDYDEGVAHAENMERNWKAYLAKSAAAKTNGGI